MMSDGDQCARSRISHWDNNILSSIDALSRSRGYVWELKGLQLDKYKERVEWGAFWLLLIMPSKLYRRSFRSVSIFNLHLEYYLCPEGLTSSGQYYTLRTLTPVSYFKPQHTSSTWRFKLRNATGRQPGGQVMVQ